MSDAIGPDEMGSDGEGTAADPLMASAAAMLGGGAAVIASSNLVGSGSLMIVMAVVGIVFVGLGATTFGVALQRRKNNEA